MYGYDNKHRGYINKLTIKLNYIKMKFNKQ